MIKVEGPRFESSTNAEVLIKAIRDFAKEHDTDLSKIDVNLSASGCFDHDCCNDTWCALELTYYRPHTQAEREEIERDKQERLRLNEDYETWRLKRDAQFKAEEAAKLERSIERLTRKGMTLEDAIKLGEEKRALAMEARRK